VGLVARLAVDAIRVIGHGHLGKLLGFGRTRLVALHAQSWSFWENRFYVDVVGVHGLRAMTGFAVNCTMRPGRKLIVLFGVTGLTDGAARKGDRPLAKVVECRSAVVTILAESGGDGERPDSEKNQDSRRHQND